MSAVSYLGEHQYAAAGQERAHKNQDPISILLNAFSNSMALFPSNLGVHGVDGMTIYRAYS